MKYENRRQAYRWNTDIPCCVRENCIVSYSRVMDLSQAGARIKSRTPPKKGTILVLRLGGGQYPATRVAGEVIWSAKGKNRDPGMVGIQFLNPPDVNLWDLYKAQ